MSIWETSSLDVGVVNVLPASGVGGGALPAAVVTTAANNSGTLTGQKVVIAGAMEDIEYCVASPPFQINGSTVTSGSYVVTFTFFAQDGTTVLETVTEPSTNCSQTVNGATVGNVTTYRLALPGANTTGTVVQSLGFPATNTNMPIAPHSVQASIVITGTCGQLTAGWTLGGHRRNRAG